MDPDVTLKLLVEALEAGKPYAAKDFFYNLFEWLKEDGFPPTLNVETSKCPTR